MLAPARGCQPKMRENRGRSFAADAERDQESAQGDATELRAALRREEDGDDRDGEEVGDGRGGLVEGEDDVEDADEDENEHNGPRGLRREACPVMLKTTMMCLRAGLRSNLLNLSTDQERGSWAFIARLGSIPLDVR